jgi:hypothetical protein
MERPLRASLAPVALRLVGAVALATLALVGATGGSAAADRQDETAASVTFTELNDSGFSGTAELAAEGNRTSVAIRVDGALGVHPTHIHQGTCADLDPNPKYPLNNVELRTTDLTGLSDTPVDVPLAELLATDHLILIHKSADEIGTYFACGDIVAGRLAAEAGTGGPAPSGPLGNTGSGPGAVDRTASLLVGAGALLAVVAVAVAVTGQRRPLRRRRA